MIPKRRLFQKSKKPKETGQVALQITSMADIFTILLVFLLKGLSSDALQISPSSETQLPVATHTHSLSEPALQIELSKEGILIAKSFVAKLKDFEPASSEIIKDGVWVSLGERLQQERERERLIAKENDSVKIDGRAILLSDEKIPFSTLKLVLKTLAERGYSDIKFGVIQE